MDDPASHDDHARGLEQGPVCLRRLTIDGIYMHLKCSEVPIVLADGEESWSMATQSQFEPLFYRKNQMVNPFLFLKDVAKVDLKAIYRRMCRVEKVRSLKREVESSSREAEEGRSEVESSQVGDERDEVQVDQEQRSEDRDEGNKNIGFEGIDQGAQDLQPSGLSLTAADGNDQ